MMQTYPCRRRAMWAQQAQPLTMGFPTTGESHEQKNEVVQSADDNAENVNKADAKANANESPHADAQGYAEKGHVKKYACPKCGKEVRRGMYFHRKYCNG